MMLLRPILHAFYGLYAWLVAVTVIALLWIPLILWPGLANRRRHATFGIKLISTLIGNPIRVEGVENLPLGAAIVVSNHISYLDGPMMLFALPPRFSFVVKAEASRVPVAAVLLRQMGVSFVSRYDAKQGSNDARRLMRMIADGQCLGFFPEGHIQRTPGLQPFRLGAFVIAARSGIPVVPAAIHGTRGFLPRNYWWPKRSPISIRLLPPIHPQGVDRAAALRLRDEAYAAVLAHCEEGAQVTQ